MELEFSTNTSNLPPRILPTRVPRAKSPAAVVEQIVPATGLRLRQALHGKAIGAVEAVVRLAVSAVEPPGRSQQGLDRLRRNDLDSVERSAVEQHLADAGEAAHRNPQAALR